MRAFLMKIMSPSWRGEAVERIADARFGAKAASVPKGPTLIVPSGGGGSGPAPALPPSVKKGVNLAEAKVMAPLVLENVAQAGEQYKRPLVAQFQEFVGLRSDSDYGPLTAGALAWALDIPPEKVPVSIKPKGAPLIPFKPPT